MLDVMVDPKDEPKSFHTPNLKWKIAPAIRPTLTSAALHDRYVKRLYVTDQLTATSIVYQIETETYRVVGRGEH